jgi:glycosyltransferase involved in cell wall biosynthesis
VKHAASSTPDTALASLTAIILTFNEHLHIRRCIENVRQVASHVVVVDSGSTDDTVAIAQSLGAIVLTNPFVNHAVQFNWALDHALIETEWVMRLDADEYLDARLLAQLPGTLAGATTEVKAFSVRRPTTFLGRRIAHGGMSPWLLRFWRRGAARCELRWMDEHMLLVDGGEVRRLPGNIVDHNLNNLSWWADKHNRYASREACDLLMLRDRSRVRTHAATDPGGQAGLKRVMKERVYSRLPLGLRPWLYFAYRLILRGGFLDGYRGMMFHTLQGLWYRLLVDAKVMQVERLIRHEGLSIEQAVREALGIELAAHPVDPSAARANK